VVGQDIIPGITAVAHPYLGDPATARYRAARTGQTGVLSTLSRDVSGLVTGAAAIIAFSREYGGAKTSQEKAAVWDKIRKRASSVRRIMARLGSEVSGIPLNQALDMIPDAPMEPTGNALKFRELSLRVHRVERRYRDMLKEGKRTEAAEYRRQHEADFRILPMIDAAAKRIAKSTEYERAAKSDKLKEAHAKNIDREAGRVLKGYDTMRRNKKEPTGR